eukprot:scaffold4321_cov33-Tisochrysis_lutea.AAC.3
MAPLGHAKPHGARTLRLRRRAYGRVRRRRRVDARACPSRAPVSRIGPRDERIVKMSPCLRAGPTAPKYRVG